MRITCLENTTGGWFLLTPFAEGCVKEHKAGEYWAPHYHAHTVETNVLWEGRMVVNGCPIEATKTRHPIFAFAPGETARPIFETDCVVFVIKTADIRNDKVTVEDECSS